ncbi:MAG: HNH endonuclease [Anaerolineaceae bacterium]|nr:HNH endonuclease [Anaerolineaceae bacterium]
MSKTYIPLALRQQVRNHFLHRCAYCLSPEWIIGTAFTIDHIIPEALGGETTARNLCLACSACNLIKGTQITAIDPQTHQLVPIFHPYLQNWFEHFSWQDPGLHIAGLTPTGRATVEALKLNRVLLVDARRWWIEVGWHPPEM